MTQCASPRLTAMKLCARNQSRTWGSQLMIVASRAIGSPGRNELNVLATPGRVLGEEPRDGIVMLKARVVGQALIDDDGVVQPGMSTALARNGPYQT